LNPVVCDPESAKTPLLRRFREIAGARYVRLSDARIMQGYRLTA
jgi:hypothetical protein